MLKWLGGLVDSNDKELKRLQPIVDKINELEPGFERLSDDDLRARTSEFRARLKDGETLDDILPEAFAAVREAARRNIGQRHFDVQLMGGIILHRGKIAEMKTGEGKTLVATLPLYLNALTGKGCHLATVNDYLARRDPYWMGAIYHALGISVASIYPQQSQDDHMPARLYDPDFDNAEDERWRYFRPVSRQEAYKADITYGTSNEFGFDYLRDNMVMELSQCVQQELNYAIVDEIDNLLIDEARTPLIISAPDVEAGQRYQIFARVAPRLQRDTDYEIDEKERRVDLTDNGYTHVESLLKREQVLKSPSFYDPDNADLHRHLRNALNAKELYKKDREYVVKNGEVIIVDEFTGRLMLGRRYSEGLHQAIEAKEGLKVQQESRTYATITIQNYFRMYNKLSGMTGTATTEAEEFHKIYKLDVLAIPTNKPMTRTDHRDRIYKNEEGKFRAVVQEIEQLNKERLPVLVGTVSIERSEYLSELLKRRGIAHHILNAKQHEKEADIISQAGQPGAVTVATNMAGRGVDIILGGSANEQDKAKWQKQHDSVVESGGLFIVGTERHEARRIDNQLRGRAGRQGDPGSSRFYVSLEDDIVRRFGGDRVKSFMGWAGMDEDSPIENALISKAIENAQVKVEGYHFDIRKHLVEYDDVINKHREVLYAERRKILSGSDLKANILSMANEELHDIVYSHSGDEHGLDWDPEGLIAEVSTIFPLPPALNADSLSEMKPKQIEERLVQATEALYEEREREVGSDNMRMMERLIMLRIIDNLWVEHLTMMENMRHGIGLQAVAQRDPLVAYKREGHNMFQNLLANIQHDVAHMIFHVNILKKETPRLEPSPMAKVAAGRTDSTGKQPLKASGRKPGRNDPCPCGSGKKYKKCCGR